MSGPGQEASLGAYAPFGMDPPSCHACRKKIAAEGQLLQHSLLTLHQMHAHRGGCFTRFGSALREAFAKAGVLRAETNAHDFPMVAASSVAIVDGNHKTSVVRAGSDANVPSVLAAAGVAVVNGLESSNVAAPRLAFVTRQD